MSATPIAERRLGRGFRFPPWNRLIVYLCAAFIVCWSVGPFLWQMSTAFQLDRQLMSGTPTLVPDPLTFDHFVNIFVAKSFQRYLFNSVIVAGATTLQLRVEFLAFG